MQSNSFDDDGVTVEDLKAVRDFLTELSNEDLDLVGLPLKESADHENVQPAFNQLTADQSGIVFRIVQFLAYHVEHQFAVLRASADVDTTLSVFGAMIDRDIKDNKVRHLNEGYAADSESDVIRVAIGGLIRTKLTPMGVADTSPFGVPKSIVEQVTLSVAYGVRPGLLPFTADFLIRGLSGKRPEVKTMVGCGQLIDLESVLSQFNFLSLPEKSAEIQQLSAACEYLQKGNSMIHEVDLLPSTALLLDIANVVATRYFLRFQSLVDQLHDQHHDTIISRFETLKQQITSKDLPFNLLDAAVIMDVTGASYTQAKELIEEGNLTNCTTHISKLMRASGEAANRRNQPKAHESKRDAHKPKSGSPFVYKGFNVPDLDF